jgi:hypothetical protein
MSGLEVVYQSLTAAERHTLGTLFHLRDAANTDGTPNTQAQVDEALLARLASDGTRLAIAGDKLLGFVMCDLAPQQRLGEYISLILKNEVLSAYLAEKLGIVDVPHRPRVNDHRFGDLLEACVCLSTLRTLDDRSVVSGMAHDKLLRARHFVIELVTWVIAPDGGAAAQAAADPAQWPPSNVLRDCVTNCLERAAASRKAAQKDAGAAESLSLDEFNRRRSVNGPAAAAANAGSKQLGINMRYFTRGGLERFFTAYLCCGALSRAACKCPAAAPEGELAAVDPDAAAPAAAAPGALAATRAYHAGPLEFRRTTKTSALRTQVIAQWLCCDALAATVNTTPLGFEVIPESSNGCRRAVP